MTLILVIEDETALREGIVEILGYSGFTTLEAPNGRVGVELAQQRQPDLIICDIAMPELDGYEVLLTLRENPETTKIPFIFLTARADRSFMRHGMELGADDYLTKPFTQTELLAAINTRLERTTKVADVYYQEVEQAKKKLTQVVAHELRTPLVSVITVQDLISKQLESLSTYELQELLSILRSGSQRLNHLVEQMVMMTQLETAILSSSRIQEYGLPTQLWELLISAMDVARRYAYRNRDAAIHLDERDREAIVKCDSQALKHALSELLTNALNFSPEGGEVSVTQWLSDDAVWVTIMDEGAGISTEELQRAAEEFQQIDRDTHEQQGMGLGLSLAHQIIELHGGNLELNSVVGKGTQVIIRLPVMA